MEKVRIMPKGHWYWSMPVPFSQGWKVGKMVFVGGQIAADEHGTPLAPFDIEEQTRIVFENVQTVLREVGAEMKDIVKLNTYYVDNSSGDESRKFWEKMTHVRNKYIPSPGPAATAVRVAGLAYDGLVIEVEAIAIVDE